MADASVAPLARGSEQATNDARNGTFTSVKAALVAVNQGQPCLHLDLTKPSHKEHGDWGDLVSAKPMTPEELAELVEALPRLRQLKTLLLACTYLRLLHVPAGCYW